MNKQKKCQERKALAEANYRARLAEAQRMAGEAFTIYEKDLADALNEYKSTTYPYITLYPKGEVE